MVASWPVRTDGRPPREFTTIRRSPDLAAVACLLGTILCWGSVPVMLRYLADPARVPDGYTSNLVRYPLSAVVFLPWLVWGARRGHTRGLWVPALLPSAVNVVGQTLWAWSPYYLPAGQLAFLVRIAVVWSIVGALVVFPDERRLAHSRRFWGGAVLAVAGFVLLVRPRLAQGAPAGLAGVAIVLFCSLFWAMYGITVRYVMNARHPLVLFSVISVYTSAVLVAMAPLGRPASVLSLSGADLVILLGSSLVGIAMAHGLYYVAVQRLGVATCELVLLTAPLLTLLGSRVLLAEAFTMLQWLGGGMLVAGAALALHAHRRPRVPLPAIWDGH